MQRQEQIQSENCDEKCSVNCFSLHILLPFQAPSPHFCLLEVIVFSPRAHVRTRQLRRNMSDLWCNMGSDKTTYCAFWRSEYHIYGFCYVNCTLEVTVSSTGSHLTFAAQSV
ncbi:MAG: hypothetical protein IJV40_15270 [Oscillospiraceae bacterium]|nr:hypothetical protein [Oscillospiraceae bacterium]